jgi:tRNA pseudouridine(55) synthase
MAHGLMLLLIGEACKEKDAYLGLDKTYRFEVLFGVATDTFDMLGIVTSQKECTPTEEDMQRAIESIKTKTIFPYPPYSSKPVDGVSLFAHARSGTLPREMPTMTGEIKSLFLKEVRRESAETLVYPAMNTIQKVAGDFRQEEICKGWETFLKKYADTKYVVATCEATVTSGVYIRTIATAIGEALQVPALAYSIERKSVGEYKEGNK